MNAASATSAGAKPAGPTQRDGTTGLKVRGLTKRYEGLTAVDRLDLTVPSGKVFGFLGPNGAGKTTTMRALLGMTTIDSGTMTWNDAPITSSTRRMIGYMPQERGLYARMRVKEQIIYFGQLSGLGARAASERADRWIDDLDLGQHADSLVQELSGGNQQRVQLAVALVHDPPLLVLDEPFAGLDPIAAQTMRRIIAQRAASGAAVLFSSHQLDMVEELCDEVVIIASGREMQAGAVPDLRAAADVRVLTVEWQDEPPSWVPPFGAIVRREGRELVAEVPAASDLNELLVAASAASKIASIRLEPPPLEQVFAQAVASATSRTERPHDAV
jgi:ABC-2 type transport system ATP-binding protein